MGLYTVTNYYTNAETAPDKNNIGTDPATQWVVNTENVVPDGARHSMAVTKQDGTKPGYGNADYTLTITAQTVQATDAALATFGLDKTTDKDLLDKCTWNLTQNK